MTDRAAGLRRRIRRAVGRTPSRGRPLRKGELALAVEALGGEPGGNIAEHRFALAAACGLDVGPFEAATPFTKDQLRDITTELETRRTGGGR
jgi:hypothetical protein